MIAEKPSWVRHEEGMQIFSIDVQPCGLRFATGGGDHKVCHFILCSLFEIFNLIVNLNFRSFVFLFVDEWGIFLCHLVYIVTELNRKKRFAQMFDVLLS